MSVIAIARVILEGDTIALTKALQGASKAMEQAGKRMTVIGKSMTTKITLPILAIGGVSVKMAATFDASMRKIVGLVGVQREIVDGWREDVRKLAVQYAASADKAADALFFITSAGQRGDEALQTLEAAMKASAAGMGEIKVVADAATSAMNAYASMGLTAARATDILTAGVRKGKLESEDLAPVMGLITGTAAALEISFEDLVGTLAVFSRTGTQATVGATQLNSIMASLLGTSKEGEAALAAQGLSLANLREVVKRPGGLLQVMRLLNDAFAGELDQLKLVIPNLRAFRGVMNALAQDVEAVDDVMDGVRNSIGITTEAFEASRGPLFLMRQSWEQFKELMLSIGNVLIPIVVPMFTNLARMIRFVTEELDHLSPAGQATLVILTGIVAILGPLLLLMGKAVLLVKSFAVASIALTAKLAGMGALLGVGGVVLIGLGLLAAAFFNAKKAAEEAAAAAEAATATLKIQFQNIDPTRAAARVQRLDIVMQGMQETVDQLRLEQLAAEEGGVASAFSEAARESKKLGEELKGQADGIQETIDRMKEFRAILFNVAEAHRAAIAAAAAGGDQAPAWLAASKLAIAEFEVSLRSATILNDLLGESFDLTGAQAEAYEAALGALSEAGVDLDAVVGPQGETFKELAKRYMELSQATEAAEKATNDLTTAQEDAKLIIESLLTSTEMYDKTVAALRVHLDEERISQEQFNRGVKQAQELLDEATKSGEDWGETLEQASSRALAGFLEFSTTAENSFRDFVDSVIRDLTRLSAKLVASKIFGFLGSIGSSEAGGGGSSPSFAHGGFLGGGAVGVVGEAGPELIQAGRAGATISPLRDMELSDAMGGSLNVNLTVQALDARSFADLVETNPTAITQPLVRALARSRALQKALLS